MKKLLLLTILTLPILLACGPDKYIKKGEEAAAIGEWYEASLQYAKAYAKIPTQDKEKRGRIAYKVAESNRKCNYIAKALSGYRNADRYHYTDTFTLRYLADMEMQSKDYKNAATHYEAYLKENPGDVMALTGLQSAAAAPLLKEKGSSYIVKEDRLFTSRYADYCPALMNDQLFFSSTRKESMGDDISGITGMKNGDIFVVSKDEKGKWKKPTPLTGGVNTKYDDGAPAFSPKGNTLYFTRCRWDNNYPRLAEIYRSTRSDASWSEAEKCVLSQDTLLTYAHPAVSPDEKYLYFISDMPGGQGGLDIWRTEILGKDFGLITNLGPDINTPGDEMFPTFRPNGDLYFSSNGRVGMGGLDIYKATPDSTASHWKVTHLPSPVNSHGDDFSMTFDGIHNRGYFSSNRNNRRGWDRLFTFECPEVVLSVKGWVYEQEGYELPAAQVYMIGSDGTNLKLSVKSDGSFEHVLTEGVDYMFLATCKGFLNHKEELSVTKSDESHEYVLQFPLASITAPVLIDNIFYDFDKATLRPESTAALDELVKLLGENPNVTIELSAHCDYKGSAQYNKLLAQRRAESVVAYLTSKGIARDRLSPVGYGKEKPKTIRKKLTEKYDWLKEGDVLTEEFIKKLDPEKQEICNQLNRRTEFIVLRTTYGMFDANGQLKAVPKKSANPQGGKKQKEALDDFDVFVE